MSERRGRLQWMVAAMATALLLSAGMRPGPAWGDTTGPIAQTAKETSVYANPATSPTLTPAQVGRLRAEIGRRDPGRIWVAVASAQQAAAAGGISRLANAVSRRIGRSGTTIAVAGSQLWLVTSYANSTAAENAVRDAFTGGRPLAAALLRAVDGIARIDPGRGSGAGTGRSAVKPTKRGATGVTVGGSGSPATGSSTTASSSGAGGAVAGSSAGPVVAGAKPSNGLSSWLVILIALAAALVPLGLVLARTGRGASALSSTGRLGAGRLGARPPWYARLSFWVGPFSVTLGAGLAVLLAITWTEFGGLPGNYDRYGRVPVPGAQVLTLPKGIVMLDFENGLNSPGNEDASELPSPPGMRIRITALTGDRAPLHVSGVPSWLFESDNGRIGHKPYARIETPAAGRYLVEAGDEFHPLVARPGASAPPVPAGVGGPVIAAGEKPWSPLGPPLVGGIVLGVLVFGAFCTPLLVLRRRERSARAATRRGQRIR